MGLGLAGVARGIKQGFKEAGDAQRQIDEDERKKKLAERDEKRFKWEERDAKRKDDDELAAKELEAALLDGANPASYQNPTADGSQAPAQQTAGIQAPAPAAGIQAPAQDAAPMGLQTAPGAAPAQAQQQDAQPKANPFMMGYEKAANPKQAYDQYMQRQEAALARYYTKTRQYDKLQELPKKMQEAREGKYAEKTKAALAGMAAGEASAPLALQKVYGWVNDGYTLDPSGAKFDAKTGTWSGLVKVDEKTGDRSDFSLNTNQIMAMAPGITPAALIKYNDERRDKAHDQLNDDRKTDAAVTTANASMKRATTLSDTEGRGVQAQADARKILAVESALTNNFKKPEKPDDNTVLMAGDPKKYPDAAKKMADYNAQLKKYESRQETITTLKDRSINLLALNPKLSATAAVAISNSPNLQTQEDKDGIFVMFRGQKVYVQ